jgi:predicted permease
LLPKEFRDIKLTMLIAASAPIGSNVAIFAQLNGLNYKTAVINVCLSTIFSIVSMPIIIGLAGFFC